MLDVLKFACETYDSDPSSPSLIVSWLADLQQWYFSFVRYSEKFGKGKYVVHRVLNSDFSKGAEQILGLIKASAEAERRAP